MLSTLQLHCFHRSEGEGVSRAFAPIRGRAGVRPPCPFCVQFHDIFYEVFRDMLYTPARARRARERALEDNGGAGTTRAYVIDSVVKLNSNRTSLRHIP